MLEGDHEQDGGGVWYCLVTDVSDRDVGDLVVMYRHQSVSQSVSSWGSKQVAVLLLLMCGRCECLVAWRWNDEYKGLGLTFE